VQFGCYKSVLPTCLRFGDCASCHGAAPLRSYVHCAGYVALTAPADAYKGSRISQQRTHCPQPDGICMSALRSWRTAQHLPVQQAVLTGSPADQTGSSSAGSGPGPPSNQSPPRPALHLRQAFGWLSTAKMVATSVTTSRCAPDFPWNFYRLRCIRRLPSGVLKLARQEKLEAVLSRAQFQESALSGATLEVRAAQRPAVPATI